MRRLSEASRTSPWWAPSRFPEPCLSVPWKAPVWRAGCGEEAERLLWAVEPAWAVRGWPAGRGAQALRPNLSVPRLSSHCLVPSVFPVTSLSGEILHLCIAAARLQEWTHAPLFSALSSVASPVHPCAALI